MSDKANHIDIDNRTLLDFLTDSLTVEEESFVSEHLNTCSECSERFQSLSIFFAKMREERSTHVPIEISKEDLFRFFAGEGDSRQRSSILYALAEGGEEIFSRVTPEEVEVYRSQSLVRRFQKLFHFEPIVLSEVQKWSSILHNLFNWQKIFEIESLQNFSPLLPISVAQASVEDTIATLEISSQEEDFVLRFAQLGDKGLVAISTPRPNLRDGLLLLEILEGKELKYRCVLALADGKAEHTFSSLEWKSIRPLQKGLTVRVQVLASLEALQQCQGEASIRFLYELAEHENPAIRKQVVQILALIRSETSNQLLEKLCEDENDEVRECAHSVKDLFGGET